MRARVAFLLLAILGAIVFLATFQIAAAHPTLGPLPPGWKWTVPPT